MRQISCSYSELSLLRGSTYVSCTMPPVIVSSVNRFSFSALRLSSLSILRLLACLRQLTPLRSSDLNKYAIDNECGNNYIASSVDACLYTIHVNSLHSLEVDIIRARGSSNVDGVSQGSNLQIKIFSFPQLLVSNKILYDRKNTQCSGIKIW